MNLGSLYLVKELYRVLFPTKEIAAAVNPTVAMIDASTIEAFNIDVNASYWMEEFDCHVSYIIPNELVVFLDKDETFLKVLTSDGRIGWTWFDEDYIDCFEEVETEES